MSELGYTARRLYIAPITLNIVHPQLLLCNATNCFTANNACMIAWIWHNSQALAKLGFKSRAKPYHPFFWKKNFRKISLEDAIHLHIVVFFENVCEKSLIIIEGLVLESIEANNEKSKCKISAWNSANRIWQKTWFFSIIFCFM